MWSRLLLISCLLAHQLSAISQIAGGPYAISGQVIDVSTQLPIDHAHVVLQELVRGAVTDDDGRYQITGIPRGSYHIETTHVGCQAQVDYRSILSDTTINIYLDHHHHEIGEVVIQSAASSGLASRTKISDKEVILQSGMGLADILSNVEGVSALRTGATVSKPVVNGLYGDRVLLLNNGLPQAGQQWGNDHNPEIDPQAPQTITVVKGAGSVLHQGATLGAVVIVEPTAIKRDPHLHGMMTGYLASNGRQHGMHLRLQQYINTTGWRVSGTVGRSGDLHTPMHYLSNTGKRDLNFTAQLDQQLGARGTLSLYGSLYTTSLGILRGSHIGNLTDLNAAIGREEPLFTSEDFSFGIEAPRQEVAHHLYKAEATFFVEEDCWLEASYGLQINDREEYDVRRGDRTDQPALSLYQISQYTSIGVTKEQSASTIKAGIQTTVIDNENRPETGVLPLIPDYLSVSYGGYMQYMLRRGQWSFDIGLRLDGLHRDVLAISSSTPRVIEPYADRFATMQSAAVASYALSDDADLSYQLGYSTRAPGVHELYSNGLHQGVSGIEEGDPTMEVERSVKQSFVWTQRWSDRLFVKVTGYHQLVNNYIYLQPLEEFRLTIRGAFPVFAYSQTNASIAGIDLSTTVELATHLHLVLKYSYIRARDLRNDMGIVFIPPSQGSAELEYEVAHVGRWENVGLRLQAVYVARQGDIAPEQDFMAPPDPYLLTGVRWSGERPIGEGRRIVTYVDVSNALDVTYRDYLNRQRYFADELGRNVRVGCSLTF